MFALFDRAQVELWAGRTGWLIAAIATWWLEPAAFASAATELAAGRWQNPALWLVLTVVAGGVVGRLLVLGVGFAYQPMALIKHVLLALAVSWWADSYPHKWQEVQTYVTAKVAETSRVYRGWRDSWMSDEPVPPWSAKHWWEKGDE